MWIRAIVSVMSLSVAAPSFAGEPQLATRSETLPDNNRQFAGSGADGINRNCLGCHSVEMVLNQPNLSRTAWLGEVTKMIKMYKAPVAPDDISAIVDYLGRTKGAN